MTGNTILRQAIIDKINAAITATTIEHIGEVYWTAADIKKMPAAVVLPDTNESNYKNTKGGRNRMFAFRIYVIKGIEKKNDTDVEKLLSAALDELIELFDKKDCLTATNLLHIRPATSVWDSEEYGGGVARIATMTLQCDVIIETT